MTVDELEDRLRGGEYEEHKEFWKMQEQADKKALAKRRPRKGRGRR